MYEFEVSTVERSDDDNARSACKREGKVLRTLSATHPRTSSTTLPLRRFRGGSPSSSSSPRRRLRSNEDFIFATPPFHRASRWSQDSVRYALFSPGYPYRPRPRAREEMFAGMFDAFARQTLSTSSLVRIHLSEMQGVPLSFK